MFAVAYKILSRRRRPTGEEALACALLAAADLSGLPFGSFPRWKPDRASAPLLAAERLLKELSERLSVLYGVRGERGPEIELPLRNWKDAVRSYRPARTGLPIRTGAAAADLEYFLRLLFGKTAFRPGQRDAVVRLLKGQDTFLVLPTGAGKSLAYQLAAMLLPGACLVVEPTLSLIEDQLASLAALGLDRAVAVTGAAGPERAEALRVLLRGEADFCYVAPERLQTEPFRRVLRLAPPCLAVVDEAHCVSEWGHDFRTSYLRLGGVLRGLGCAVLAATGTASGAVLQDVRVQLALESRPSLVAPLGPERLELCFRVLRCPSSRKKVRLQELLSRLAPSGPGILFCPRVDGPFGARTQARELAVEAYHGKADSEARRATAARFKDGRAPLLAATKAFGLGIDNPGVRYTVHLSLPSSIEAFYQEAGRAGRDGRPAECWILASIDDVPRALWLLDPETSVEEVRREVERTPARDADDVIRALQLHARSFRGPDREREDVLKVVGRLGELSPGSRRLLMPGQHRPLIEKALHRLCCLGVASDFTVDHRVPEFLVRLTGKPVVEAELDRLLASIYGTVEKERRACLGRLVAACLPGVDDAELGRRVLDYLKWGEPTRNESFGLPPSPRAGRPG